MLGALSGCRIKGEKTTGSSGAITPFPLKDRERSSFKTRPQKKARVNLLFRSQAQRKQ